MFAQLIGFCLWLCTVLLTGRGLGINIHHHVIQFFQLINYPYRCIFDVVPENDKWICWIIYRGT